MPDLSTELAIASAIASQSQLNEAVSRCLQAVALSADRHDAEVEELREEIAALSNRIAEVQRLALRAVPRDAATIYRDEDR